MTQKELLHVIRECDAGVEIVRVVGEVDIETFGVFESAMLAAISDLDSAEVLVVDLLGVTFLGSVGLNGLVKLHYHCGDESISLRVVATGATVGRPMRITGLDMVLSMYETLEDALAA